MVPARLKLKLPGRYIQNKKSCPILSIAGISDSFSRKENFIKKLSAGILIKIFLGCYFRHFKDKAYQ